MRRIYVRWVSDQVLRQSAMENVMGALAQRVPSATLTWSTTRHQYLNSLLMQGLQRFETIDFLSGCIEREGCLLYLSNSAILSRKAAPNKSTIQTALSVFGPHIQSLGVGILILLPFCRLIERERNNIRSRFACVRQQNGQTRRVVQLLQRLCTDINRYIIKQWWLKARRICKEHTSTSDVASSTLRRKAKVYPQPSETHSPQRPIQQSASRVICTLSCSPYKSY